MTRAEALSLAIARHKEPEPELPTVFEDNTPDCSPLGYWVLRSRPTWHWAPMFRVTDAPYAMRLLKELLAAPNECKQTWDDIRVAVIFEKVPLELAIAEAYVVAFGVEVL